MEQYPHILIVDDDNRILKLLKQFLCQNNFLVSTCISTDEAVKLLSKFVYDLIILDVMMPQISGVEFAKQIKESGAKMPIVMLTALSEPYDKIKGLEAGANDYITKPFEPRELLLRIQNLVNSYNQHKKEQSIVRFGNNSYNFLTKMLLQNNENINLTSKEEQLLEILLLAKNNVISREGLAERLKVLNVRSVDVHIVRLRKKIEQDLTNPRFLKTVRNEGYALYT